MRRFWLAFFALGCTLAGLGFAWKLREFFFDVTNREGFEFATVHLLTYALVAAGFVLLLLSAFLRGHFSDIEQPKYTLLDREIRLDLDEYGPDDRPR